MTANADHDVLRAVEVRQQGVLQTLSGKSDKESEAEHRRSDGEIATRIIAMIDQQQRQIDELRAWMFSARQQGSAAPGARKQ